MTLQRLEGHRDKEETTRQSAARNIARWTFDCKEVRSLPKGFQTMNTKRCSKEKMGSSASIREDAGALIRSLHLSMSFPTTRSPRPISRNSSRKSGAVDQRLLSCQAQAGGVLHEPLRRVDEGADALYTQTHRDVSCQPSPMRRL